jgi:hypothetical protein
MRYLYFIYSDNSVAVFPHLTFFSSKEDGTGLEFGWLLWGLGFAYGGCDDH